MYSKGLIMEVRGEYALAMEEGGRILRIRAKTGLSEGDEVYILPEDILDVGQTENRARKRIAGTPFRAWAAGLAAVLVICIVLMVPQLRVPAVYAEVSVDGDAAIQLLLDEEYRIIRAESPDGSIPETALKELEGMRLEDAAEKLVQLCGGQSLLIGCAVQAENGDNAVLMRKLKSMFSGTTIVVVAGNSADIRTAGQQTQSLGRYLLDRHITGDALEDILEELPEEELTKMLAEDPKWMDNEDFRDALEDSMKRSESAGQTAAAGDDEDDDDEEEDRDNAASQNVVRPSNKKSTASPSASQEYKDNDPNDNDDDDRYDTDEDDGQ